MSSNSVIRQRFNLPFNQFIQKSRKINTCVRKDLFYFREFGINEQYLHDIEIEILSLERLPTDSDLKSELKVCVGNRDSTLKKLSNELKNMILRFQLVYDNRTIKSLFSSLQVKGLAPDEMIFFANRVIKTSQTHFDKLKAMGVTQIKISQLQNLVLDCNNFIQEVVLMQSRRKKITIERKEKANVLYNKLSTLCEIGKTIWTDNPVKLQDYFIYHTSRKLVENKISVTDVLIGE